MFIVFGDMNIEKLLIYLDDLIIFSKTFDEHLERLQQVFDRLRQHGLKLKPSKCYLFKREVKYLGHIVTEHGIPTDPEKVAQVKEWTTPQSQKRSTKIPRICRILQKIHQGFWIDCSSVAQVMFERF